MQTSGGEVLICCPCVPFCLQKSLLLSIFPDSVAQQMTEEVVHDLEEHFSKFGENNDGEELPFLLAVKQGDQFYRSFMDRCENVR